MPWKTPNLPMERRYLRIKRRHNNNKKSEYMNISLVACTTYGVHWMLRIQLRRDILPLPPALDLPRRVYVCVCVRE